MRGFGEIDGNKVCITDHALTRMAEMGITPEEFRGLILDPEEKFTSPKYDDTSCHRKGKYSMALSVKEDGTIFVITVLYATLEDWCDAAKEGMLGDRQLRVNTAIPRRRRE